MERWLLIFCLGGFGQLFWQYPLARSRGEVGEVPLAGRLRTIEVWTRLLRAVPMFVAGWLVVMSDQLLVFGSAWLLATIPVIIFMGTRRSS